MSTHTPPYNKDVETVADLEGYPLPDPSVTLNELGINEADLLNLPDPFRLGQCETDNTAEPFFVQNTQQQSPSRSTTNEKNEGATFSNIVNLNNTKDQQSSYILPENIENFVRAPPGDKETTSKPPDSLKNFDATVSSATATSTQQDAKVTTKAAVTPTGSAPVQNVARKSQPKKKRQSTYRASRRNTTSESASKVTFKFHMHNRDTGPKDPTMISVEVATDPGGYRVIKWGVDDQNPHIIKYYVKQYVSVQSEHEGGDDMYSNYQQLYDTGKRVIHSRSNKLHDFSDEIANSKVIKAVYDNSNLHGNSPTLYRKPTSSHMQNEISLNPYQKPQPSTGQSAKINTYAANSNNYSVTKRRAIPLANENESTAYAAAYSNYYSYAPQIASQDRPTPENLLSIDESSDLVSSSGFRGNMNSSSSGWNPNNM